MGGRACKPVVEFADCVRQLPPGVLDTYSASFMALAKKSGAIDKATFHAHVLNPRLGREWGPPVQDRVFALVDLNSNGSISWDEYLVCQYLWNHGTPDHRLQVHTAFVVNRHPPLMIVIVWGPSLFSICLTWMPTSVSGPKSLKKLNWLSSKDRRTTRCP